jgi:hypothetical protein
MTDIRYLFMAMPPREVRRAMQAFLARHGLDAHLGATMFAMENWHQSLSDRFWDPSADVVRRCDVQALECRFKRQR